MKSEHIIEILDSTPFSRLSAEQLRLVQAHSRYCSACESAYQAVMLSSGVIKSRVQTTIEPSPFFQTKVLAALRERQAIENIPAFVRLWKSAGALLSSMAVTTAALGALSLMAPVPATPSSEQTASAYSAEAVIFDQSNEDQMTYEQVFSTIYANDDEAK